MVEPNSPLNQTDIPPSESLPRKSASPLLWLLLLAIVAAFAWFIYSKRQPEVLAPIPADTTTTTTPAAPATMPPASGERSSGRAADRSEPNRIVRADRAASPISPGKPEYPIVAARAHEKGLVMVRVDVDANGHPGNATITRHSGSRDLDSAALATVRKWQFKPAIENGKQVASAVEVPVEFKLDMQ